jgi:molybdate transport system substrate-binding protein
MLWYKPLCFTRYVLAVPKGNPAGITSIKDMAKPGICVVLSFGASPPGGKATMGLMKKAGVLEGAQKNAVFNGDCVQRTTKMLVNGKADAGIVEQRITCLPEFRGKLDTIPIDEKHFPPPPMTFTIGMMKWAKDPEVAKNYIDFILSPEGQKHFENAGFIPSISDEGKRLTKKYGV